MKNILIVCGVCLMLTIGSFLSSAEVFKEVNNMPELYLKEFAAGGSFLNELSHEEVVSVLSSMPFEVDQEDIKKAVSKMDIILITVLVDYVKDMLANNIVSDKTTFNLLIECESPEAASGLMQGVGRLILWEMHNGLNGIRCSYNESLSKGNIECEITGLRGVFDIILVLRDDFSAYARFYCPDK